MSGWRFAALAAALALLMLAAAHIDGARREKRRSRRRLPGAGDPALVPALEAHLERAPRDGRGWVLLARLHFADRPLRRSGARL